MFTRKTPSAPPSNAAGFPLRTPFRRAATDSHGLIASGARGHPFQQPAEEPSRQQEFRPAGPEAGAPDLRTISARQSRYHGGERRLRRMAPNIFISAGEASGEHYGALLIEELKRRLAGNGRTAHF